MLATFLASRGLGDAAVKEEGRVIAMIIVCICVRVQILDLVGSYYINMHTAVGLGSFTRCVIFEYCNQTSVRYMLYSFIN